MRDGETHLASTEARNIMELKNQVEFKRPGFNKAKTIFDTDTSLGEGYDHACALLNYFVEKMKEVQPKELPPEQPKEEKSDVVVADSPV
jgi:hypothetical protein